MIMGCFFTYMNAQRILESHEWQRTVCGVGTSPMKQDFSLAPAP